MTDFEYISSPRETIPTLEEYSESFVDLLTGSYSFMKCQQELNKMEWNLGSEEGFRFDQPKGMLYLDFADGAVVECTIQVIGTFSRTDQSWCWSWGNDAINEDLTKDTQKLFDYGQRHKIDILAIPYWPAHEEWAEAMQAFATLANKSKGSYVARIHDIDVYLTFRSVDVIKRPT